MAHRDKASIDGEREHIEASFVGFATAMVVCEHIRRTPPAKLVKLGHSLMLTMNDLAYQYAALSQVPGTFMMHPDDIVKWVAMSPTARLEDGASWFRGFLHIGSGGPIACTIEDAVKQCDLYRLDFRVLDPMDLAMSDEVFDEINNLSLLSKNGSNTHEDPVQWLDGFLSKL